MMLFNDSNIKSSFCLTPCLDPVKNIGSLDQLGNFYLDPKIQVHFEVPLTSFWDRLKQDYVNRNNAEVQKEVKKIIREIFEELIRLNPEMCFPDCIQDFIRNCC